MKLLYRKNSFGVFHSKHGLRLEICLYVEDNEDKWEAAAGGQLLLPY